MPAWSTEETGLRLTFLSAFSMMDILCEYTVLMYWEHTKIFAMAERARKLQRKFEEIVLEANPCSIAIQISVKN